MLVITVTSYLAIRGVCVSWCPECYFLIFEVGHFDLLNQLCDHINGVGTDERCDHVNLVSAAPSWDFPYSVTF